MTAQQRIDRELQVKQLQSQLAAKGIYAMYGGRKGHGFWLYQYSREQAEKIITAERTGSARDIAATLNWIDHQYAHSPIIRNDGKRSGNPCFWLFADAKKLADQPREVTAQELADLSDEWENPTVDTAKYYQSVGRAYEVDAATYLKYKADGGLCQQRNGKFYIA